MIREVGDEMGIHLLFIAFFLSVILCVLLTPIIKKIAIAIGATDKPNERKVHKTLMPRMGGVAIYLSFTIVYFLFTYFTDLVITNVGLAIVIGGFFVVAIGVIDDMVELSPTGKFVGQLVGAVIAIYFGLKIQYITIPFLNDVVFIGWLGIPLTLVWIIAVTNAVNLIDGLDGLAAGVSAIAALSLFAVSLSIGNYMTAFICLVLVGCIVGFLFFNFHPASIFMGDSGSLFLGFFLSIVSLLELKQVTIISMIIPILLLSVPIMDTLYAMVRRKLSGKPLMQADKGHLHHRLLAMGYSHRNAVLLIYTISSFFAILAILVTKVALWVSIVFFIFYLIFFEFFAESIGMLKKEHRPLMGLYLKISKCFNKEKKDSIK